MKDNFAKRYILTHRYRAKNGFGALDLDEIRISLNTDLDCIIDVEAIK